MNTPINPTRPDRATRHRRLREWLEREAPQDLDVALREAAEARELLLHELAERLEGPINSRLRAQPVASYADRTQQMRFLTKVLVPLDLAVCEPVSRRPAILVGTRSSNPRGGAYQFRVMQPDGSWAPTATHVRLSALELTPRPARWTQLRTGPQR